MANRFVFGFFITTGMLSLAACTSVQTASERQTYFENASTAKLAWQPMPNESTSFQGCAWSSVDYPCQPYSKLRVSQQTSGTSLKRPSSTTASHKNVIHKKKAPRTNTLPLCQPAPTVNAQVTSHENDSVLINKTST